MMEEEAKVELASTHEIEKENELDKSDDNEGKQREDIYSKVVRAGKRTYFFDVKATRNNDYYMTVTESKKVFNRNGRYFFEKHKIFLYKEDFEKFADALNETIGFIKTSNPTISIEHSPESASESDSHQTSNSFSDVHFDDLDKGKE